MVLPRRGARVPPLPTPGLRGAPSAGRRPGTRTCGPPARRPPPCTAHLPVAPRSLSIPPRHLVPSLAPTPRPARGPPSALPVGPRSLPSLLYSLLSPAPPSLPTLSRLSRDERAPGGVLLLRRPGEGTSRARGRPGPTWERRAASRGHPGAPGRPRGSPKATAPSHDLGSHPLRGWGLLGVTTPARCRWCFRGVGGAPRAGLRARRAGRVCRRRSPQSPFGGTRHWLGRALRAKGAGGGGGKDGCLWSCRKNSINGFLKKWVEASVVCSGVRADAGCSWSR